MNDDPFRTIAELIEREPAAVLAPREPPSRNPQSQGEGDGEPDFASENEAETLTNETGGPSDTDKDEVDGEALAFCAGLDHSDTDNGKRLLKHFGDDLRVLKQAEAKAATYVAWTGTHWDHECGALGSHAIAQKVGGRIGLEADFLTSTPAEKKLIEEGEEAEFDLDELEKAEDDWSDADKRRARDLRQAIEAGDAARAELKKRKIARRKFAVSSKNKARIDSMLACAAPHCAVDPDTFNADPFVLATKKHTLRFVREIVREIDLDCPDPDVTRYITHYAAKCEASAGHSRDDMLTRYVPLTYDKAAGCPRWLAFLEEFLPVPNVRAFVQTFSGLGLLGRTVQMVLFHYGGGANGKSVFLETLMRVLGPLAVGLPAESITGQGDRNAGGASPDLARLYGARALRVLELPADKPLHEDLIKKLTGGEKIPVRTLFKGYFEFTPIFSCHMSGNGYPRIDGTDNGIWRRMAVVHWPVTIEEARQKPFDDVLASFAPEYPGILNWLIEGALRFLVEGLHVPDEVKAATAEYRSEMDPMTDFVADCVERVEGGSETARVLYDAYVSWSLANARRAVSETKFAKVMKTRFTRTDERVRRYLDCRLHDVPTRPEASRNPHEGEGGFAEPRGG